jgi:hypothetical protein
MTALLTFLLLLTATTAQAEHVWLYCGDPPTERVGVYDSSAECWDKVKKISFGNDHCEDTKGGPRFDGERMPGWDSQRLRTCAEVRTHYMNCLCQPEPVP